VSATVETRVVDRGNDGRVGEVWALKERVSETDGVLRQRKGFFTRAYRQSAAHLIVVNDDVAGFAVVRRDGYLLFLAVAPEHRGQGFGRRLVTAIADAHPTVTCHARTTNRDAIEFYEHLGFERKRRIEGYYEDGGDAYYFQLDATESLTDRLTGIVGR
jgi:ribosomal protein S18 acetylase RimI-like enzyme